MNITKKLFLFSIIAIFIINCEKVNKSEKNETAQSASELKIIKQKQDSIIDEHLKKGARKYSYNSPEWQTEIDKGLAKDSTIAYLWQQKAMPLFKQGKYEIGMEYIDKAVKYDRQSYQPYRAFIKTWLKMNKIVIIEEVPECDTGAPSPTILASEYKVVLSYYV